MKGRIAIAVKISIKPLSMLTTDALGSGSMHPCSSRVPGIFQRREISRLRQHIHNSCCDHSHKRNQAIDGSRVISHRIAYEVMQSTLVTL